MHCIGCDTERPDSLFPAPDALLKICRDCLGSLASNTRVNCQKCGKDTYVQAGGRCARCATDGRFVRWWGPAHVADETEKQTQDDSR